MPTQATPEHRPYCSAYFCRSEAELHEVIEWLTGYTKADIDRHIADKSTFKNFFGEATLHSQTLCTIKK